MTDQSTPAPDTGGEADGWIEWHGGENPVPGCMVEIHYRSFDTVREQPFVRHHGAEGPSSKYAWGHDGSSGDIIAYRVVSVPSPRIAEGELAAFADAMRRQVDASAGNLKKSGADGHLVDICLSHFNDLADRLAALSAPSVSPSEELGSSAKSPIPTEGHEAAVLWAVERWKAEVENRPLVNKNRRPLDDAWRQVIRHFGGDPDTLLPLADHDTLIASHQPAAPGEKGRVR